MGIDIHAFNFLKFCTRNNAPLGKTLTLGRQGNHVSWADPETGLVDYYCEPMLKKQFKATSVMSVDASDYENATFIQDLNKSWECEGLISHKFKTIIDAGTLEHVFNVPQALESVANACELGGQIIHIQNHSDFSGHGFWQFSAELFQRWYSKDNGFADLEIFIAPYYDKDFWYRCLPTNGINRLELSGRQIPQSYILVRAKKIHVPNQYICYQSDYVSTWNNHSEKKYGDNKKSSLIKTKKINFVGIKRAIKLLIPSKIKRYLRSNFFKWQHEYLIRENVKKILLDK